MKRQPQSPKASPSLRLVTPRLPEFTRGGRPRPETPARKLFIHSVALLTILLSYAYLFWRATSTVDLAVWWVALPLLAAEMHNGFGLILYTMGLWDIDVSPPWRPIDKTSFRIAVLIPTYNEPENVLLPTIAAAVALEPDHETWVLDDGRRPEVRQLAKELNARYLTRDDNRHAKAGNLNHALSVIEADLVGVLDADHVAGPNFLRHTLCYFDDAKVAVVQTPQDFYNLESFEHEPMSDRPFNEESVFYRVIAPGKNKWGAAFWCGTSAVIRTEALSSVGGVATETVTEDIHTTIRLNRAGWKGVYHNEVLARGLAPSDAVQYMLQRNRWAAGAMQVLRDENPLLVSGLTLGQRLGFATTLFGWFDSWRTSTFIVLPIVVLFTGASPIDAPGYLYGPFFLSAFILQFFALRLLARGHYPPLLSLLFEVLRMPAVLPATLAIFGRKGARSFRVTPKGQGGGRKRVPVPLLLTGLALASAGAILWFAATAAGLTFVQYSEFPAVIGSLLFASVNLALLLAAIHRIRETRFAGERRASVRFDVRLRGHLGGVPCEVEDISLTGAKAFLARGRTFSSDRAALEIDLGEEAARLYVDVLRQTVGLGRTEIALQFRPAQRAAIGNLALRLLNSEDEYSYVGGSAAAPAA